METSDNSNKTMAEELGNSDLTSVSTMPGTKEEPVYVDEGIVREDSINNSEQMDHGSSDANKTNYTTSDVPSAAGSSFSDPLQVLKALQTYALTNILSAHQNANASQAIWEEANKRGSDVPNLMASQNLFNLALYGRLMSNATSVVASQSPYMSLIGNLLSNVNRLASDNSGSVGETSGPGLVASKVANSHNALASIIGESFSQETTIKKVSNDAGGSSLQTSNVRETDVKRVTNNIDGFKVGESKHQGKNIKKKVVSCVASGVGDSHSQETNVKKIANDGDHSFIRERSNIVEKSVEKGATKSLLSSTGKSCKHKTNVKRAASGDDGDRIQNTCSQEASRTDVDIIKVDKEGTRKNDHNTSLNITLDASSNRNPKELNECEEDGNTLTTLKRFRKGNENPLTEATKEKNTGNYTSDVPTQNPRIVDTLSTGEEKLSEVNQTQPVPDNAITTSTRRRYRKREKTKEDYEMGNDEKKFSCSICAKLFKLEASLTKHMWLHTGEQPFTCSVCEKKFTEKSNLTTHMRIHTGEKPHLCTICGRRFTQQASLMYHTRSHTGEKPYECKMCNKGFVSSSGLNSHMISHSTYRPFKCEVCNNTFARKSGLDLHMMVHTGEKPFECKECGKLFTQRGALTSHTKQHTGERRFHCEECGKTFVDNCTLKKHLRIHSGELPYQCELCGKRFLHRTSYIEHMKVHNDERTYPCPVCGKLFRNKSSVNTHMVTHTKERPHECDECGKKFALKSNLKHHMKIHNGSREFVCEVCGQAFLFKDTLREHFKTHTGEKTYNCQICGKGYMWKPSFLRHMEEIHGQKPEDNLSVANGINKETLDLSCDNIESVILRAEQSNDTEDEEVTAFEFVGTDDDFVGDKHEMMVDSSANEAGNEHDKNSIREDEKANSLDLGDESMITVKEEEDVEYDPGNSGSE